MPDLIIKPAAQSGNKVIIQDQAGGAVITTADSGATIANATLVAPALGTVATGNLSNTAIVYPAGHVIQVATTSKTDTNSWSNSQSWTDTGLTCAITPAATANKILVLWQLNSISLGDQVSIGLNRAGGMINIGDATGSKLRATAQAMIANTNVLSYMNDTVSGMYLDSPSSSSSVTYKIQIYSATTGSIVYINRSPAHRDYTHYDSVCVSNITLMEIKG